MPKPLSHYRQRLAEKGLSGVIASRLRWYKQSFQMDNWLVGKLVELFGNTITVQGVRLSVDNPLITPRYKSSLYFGIYEIYERKFTTRYIDRSLPTIELGGSIGGVACITNRLLENPKRHVVVECSPIILPTLKKNRERNACQFTIEEAALAYGAEQVKFSVNDFMCGRIDPAGKRQVTVAATTLGKLLDKHGFDVINLISDCEGTEVEMLENEREVFRNRVKHLVMETHRSERGDVAIEKTLSALGALGFEIQDQDEKATVFAMVNRHLA